MGILELIGSFLDNKRFYVEIQGYKSTMKYLGSQSAIQGSKLASTFYTIFTLDIGQLDILMKDKEINKLMTERNM